MPLYEYFCEQCRKEITVPMTISDHDRGTAACPECGSRDVRQLIGAFFSKTSRKS